MRNGDGLLCTVLVGVRHSSSARGALSSSSPIAPANPVPIRPDAPATCVPRVRAASDTCRRAMSAMRTTLLGASHQSLDEHAAAIMAELLCTGSAKARWRAATATLAEQVLAADAQQLRDALTSLTECIRAMLLDGRAGGVSRACAMVSVVVTRLGDGSAPLAAPILPLLLDQSYVANVVGGVHVHAAGGECVMVCRASVTSTRQRGHESST